MSRTFWLVTPSGRAVAHLTAADRQLFRQDALEITMYSVGDGEAIVVSQGSRAILVDGGSGSRKKRNDSLGTALGSRLDAGTLHAIVASHPHQDHTNFYPVMVTNHTDRFAAGAEFFDNATPGADSAWTNLKNWQPNPSVQRVPVHDTQAQDAIDRISQLPPLADAYMFRGTTGATSVNAQKYWSVFMLLRYRNAWMLFTGDAHKSYENLLLPRLQALTSRVHLLKVTHHGSSSGTSPQLVAALNPAIAIASTDADPGHRLEPDVRMRLSNAAIYMTYDPSRPTKKAKDIVVRTDGFVWEQPGFGQGVLFEVWTRNPVL